MTANISVHSALSHLGKCMTGPAMRRACTSPWTLGSARPTSTNSRKIGDHSSSSVSFVTLPSQTLLTGMNMNFTFAPKSLWANDHSDGKIIYGSTCASSTAAPSFLFPSSIPGVVQEEMSRVGADSATVPCLLGQLGASILPVISRQGCAWSSGLVAGDWMPHLWVHCAMLYCPHSVPRQVHHWISDTEVDDQIMHGWPGILPVQIFMLR